MSAAIAVAVLDELAETGYGATSMEAVARRARVGKAALYRRWPSKEAMVQHVVSRLMVSAAPIPDTGSLRADVHAYIQHANESRHDLRTTRIIADLSAEAIRNQNLAQFFSRTLREPRRIAGAAMLQRAIARKELPANLDTDLALDCLVALTYARPQSLSGAGELMDPYDIHQLVEVTCVALQSCQRKRRRRRKRQNE